MRSKKIAKYENMLKQSDKEEGMYHVENGTLFINAGEPYLEHHGVLGMKWGKHLRAGKGPASAPASSGGGGGGAPEEDEETKKKIEEAAKKAGMTADEYRKKFADKVAEIKKAAYNAANKAKKEIGYAYGSEYKKDFERAARLHENNSRSMREQAKAAWEGYGESRTAAQRDNWNRYKEYDRQANASGNMFVKRERSKQAYDNSLASKVDSVKRKSRLTADKLKTKASKAEAATKGTASKVGSAVYDAAGGSHKKDAAEYRKMSRDASNEARKYEASGNADLAKAASAKRKGNTSAHSSYKTTGDNAKDEARKARERASALSEGARQEQARYEKSLAGRYDRYKAAKKRKRKSRLKVTHNVTVTKVTVPKHTLPKLKHYDDTNAIYTEGTRLVVNSKWG